MDIEWLVMKIVWVRTWWSGKISYKISTNESNGSFGKLNGIENIFPHDVIIDNSNGPEQIAMYMLKRYTSVENGYLSRGMLPGVMTKNHREIILFFEKLPSNKSEG